jgi:hypothetical protein
VGRFHGCRSAGPLSPGNIDWEIAAAASVFQDLFGQQGAIGARWAGFGIPESLVLTKTERRLLHAIAAAQAEDAEVLDNYLYKLALHREARSRLAAAVTTLAACLAIQGHWLPRGAESRAIPAAALTVARTHGWDMQAVRVAWPRR